jgi:hypothetical protein
MVIKLSGDLERDFALLGDILANPDVYIKHVDIEAVKNTTSLIRNVTTLFG